MECLLSSCKPRDEGAAKRSLCSGVRIVYLRGDQHTEELVYLTR